MSGGRGRHRARRLRRDSRSKEAGNGENVHMEVHVAELVLMLKMVATTARNGKYEMQRSVKAVRNECDSR